jgi:hypothetical protein
LERAAKDDKLAGISAFAGAAGPGMNVAAHHGNFTEKSLGNAAGVGYIIGLQRQGAVGETVGGRFTKAIRCPFQ